MKKIYVVLTYTGTLLSKVIKEFTKDEFSHVSISLDIELEHMYSFGRLHPYNMFMAGFVQERIHEGTFKRFYNTRTKVYELAITEEQYEKLAKNIELIKREKGKYKFNILGLFAVGFHKKLRGKNSFYCAEFVKYVMEQAGIKTNLPEIVKPEDFKQIEGLQEIYGGYLRKYQTEDVKLSKRLRDILLLYSKRKSTV